MRVYRIKEYRKKDGLSYFHPQKRRFGFLWWYTMYKGMWSEDGTWKEYYYELETYERALKIIREEIKEREVCRKVYDGRKIESIIIHQVKV